jgi:hypothetical protein
VLSYFPSEDIVSVLENYQNVFDIQEQDIFVVPLPCQSFQQPKPNIRISVGRSKAKLVHAVTKVMPKNASSNVASV